MTKYSLIGILLCIVISIGSAGCYNTNPSAEAASQFHPVVDEVIKLLEADIDEETILAYIRKHGSPEDISADEIITMNEAGVSEAIVMMMIGSQCQAPSSEFPFNLTDNLIVDTPITHHTLAIYPVYLAETRDTIEFLTLDEAQQLNLIIITEKDGGTVPGVIIENTSQQPIYICAGEIIFGGKQDRMIAHDIIISPSSSAEVKVRCVESGRWHGSTSRFSSSGFMGSSKLRDAAQFMDQSDVWARVAEQNAQLQTETITGAYQASLTHDQVQVMYEEFADAVLDQLEGANLVGMIVSSNGNILCIDIFNSPALFDSLKEKLLKASVLDIIGIEEDGSSLPGKQQILDFYNNAVSANSERLQEYQYNANNKRENENAAVNESVDKSNPSQIYHQNIIQKQSFELPCSDQTMNNNSDRQYQYQQILR